MRYIIERFVCFDYGFGYITLMENNKPKIFANTKEAFDWLVENDKDFVNLSIIEVAKLYEIKPYTF